MKVAGATKFSLHSTALRCANNTPCLLSFQETTSTSSSIARCYMALTTDSVRDQGIRNYCIQPFGYLHLADLSVQQEQIERAEQIRL